MLELPAYAKINLSLEITGRRSDGFHNIVSLIQLVSLHDALRFEHATTGIDLHSDDQEMIAEGGNNLVVRAARALQEATGTQEGATITLIKRIPSAAGLGGGSSDAAATLVGLNRLWSLNLSNDELSSLGEKLGSDVPFFFSGPTALVEGRGEQVTRISPSPRFHAVLVYSPYNIPAKTKRLYAALSRYDMSDGVYTRGLADTLQRREANLNIEEEPLLNSFKHAAWSVFSGLQATAGTMQSLGAPNVHLSGSGPTLYSLYSHANKQAAQNLHQSLLSKGLQSYLVSSEFRDKSSE